MKERILSGAMLILFLAAVVVFNRTLPFALNIAVALISVLAVYELLKALNVQKKLIFSISSLLTALLIPIVTGDLYMFIIYCAFTAAMFIGLIANHERISFKEVAVVYSMTILIPVALQTLPELRMLGGEHGMLYVILAILASWVSDAGAYFAGTFWGRHKLAPKISPKKTVEGAIGGVVANVAIMLLIGFLFAQILHSGEKRVNYLLLAVIGLVSSFTSMLGDLSFSLIKRSCHIKDFSHVIPGHGGILDRFDSVIFTAPFIYILVSFFPIVLN